MRAAFRRASLLILRAEDELQEAGSVIANGYLRLDREEWIRVVEKRSRGARSIPPTFPTGAGEDGSTRLHGRHWVAVSAQVSAPDDIRRHPTQRAGMGS